MCDKVSLKITSMSMPNHGNGCMNRSRLLAMKQFVPEDESDHLIRCLRVIKYRMKIDHDLIAIEVDGCERTVGF